MDSETRAEVRQAKSKVHEWIKQTRVLPQELPQAEMSITRGERPLTSAQLTSSPPRHSQLEASSRRGSSSSLRPQRVEALRSNVSSSPSRPGSDASVSSWLGDTNEFPLSEENRLKDLLTSGLLTGERGVLTNFFGIGTLFANGEHVNHSEASNAHQSGATAVEQSGRSSQSIALTEWTLRIGASQSTFLSEREKSPDTLLVNSPLGSAEGPRTPRLNWQDTARLDWQQLTAQSGRCVCVFSCKTRKCLRIFVFVRVRTSMWCNGVQYYLDLTDPNTHTHTHGDRGEAARGRYLRLSRMKAGLLKHSKP